MRPLIVAAIACAALASGTTAGAHCQIPCGIYGDEMRFEMLDENIRTVQKSMESVVELSAAEPIDFNQVVRWVDNKEHHAQRIQDIAHEYFLAQRIKIPAAGDSKAQEDYVASLKWLHQIIVYAMKAKQSTDLEVVARLREAVAGLETVYMEGHGH